MIEVRRRLTKPLDRFVDCLWYSSGEVRPHRKERLLPTGCANITFKLGEGHIVRILGKDDVAGQSLGRAVASGAYSRPYVIDTSRPSPTLGVHFRPGGAAPLLGVPLSKLLDRHIPLEELWGRESAVLRERLMDARSVSTMFDLVEQTLLDQLSEPPQDHSAILRAVAEFSSGTTTRVKAMSDSLSYCSKRFICQFHDAVGLTPKVFCRIQRFQAVLDRIVGGKQIHWAGMAVDGGYYDQSHMIRDFRTFAGVTPREYRPVAAGRKNHLALDS